MDRVPHHGDTDHITMAHTERKVFKPAAQSNDKRKNERNQRGVLNITAQDKTKIETDKEAITEAITDTVTKFFMKDIENSFASSRPEHNKPDEEIPIYEKLSPGEIIIISRSDKGFLVAANCDGECDIRYYNDSEE